MHIKLTRTFHPVGQGAFYSERFTTTDGKEFNVVYDCGTLSGSNSIEKIIKNNFKGKEIDILFISHFDSDHVNGIKLLKDNAEKIKTVILPLLDKQQKILLTRIYKFLEGEDGYTANLIDNPEDFFGNDTKIIKIKQVTEEEGTSDPIKNWNDLEKSEELHSGTIIQLPTEFAGQYFWQYQPYNYKFPERNRQLAEALAQSEISEQDLQNPDYIKHPANQKKIKKLYNSPAIEGTINENSMLVYSNTPRLNCINCHDESHSKIYPPLPLCRLGYLCRLRHLYYKNLKESYRQKNRMGCIYTGDANLIKIIKNKLFKKITPNRVGTIQVAHHGSHKNFDIAFFNNSGTNLFCPISFGSNNTYGHPSGNVLNNLIVHGHLPIFIDEFEESSFSQVFYFCC
ncbi:MAG: MBL fold metallo-hydrolase [Brachymonas sp.]|nr:MBL fold metallo-hydrolase [Brachymonas sp.]